MNIDLLYMYYLFVDDDDVLHYTYILSLFGFSPIIQGPGGVTVKKTNQALIIGIYDEPMTPGQCNMIVERLGDYLIEQGL